MPISATGKKPLSLGLLQARSTRGFTLIELLVVMVVIGITVALIAPNFLPDDATLIKREAQTTALKLEYAYSYAESTGIPIAWLPKENASEFQELDETGHWKTLSNNGQLTATFLPQEMTWGKQDRIIFVPGDAAPEYQIQLSLRNKTLSLQGNALGKVGLKKLDGDKAK
jgi:general secretion pathway protein H